MPGTKKQSPARLTSGFAARGHTGIYVPMQVPDGELERVMHGLSRIPSIDGVLVTMPHTFAAYTYCVTRSSSPSGTCIGT
jgi:shikimate dehydrogenase